MAREWLVDEYRNAVVLTATVRVIQATLGRGTLPTLTPLRTELQPSIDRLFAELLQFVQKGGGSRHQQMVDSPAAELVGQDVLEAVVASPPNKVQLMMWWLRAGPVPQLCKKVLPKRSVIRPNLRKFNVFRKKTTGADSAEAIMLRDDRLRQVIDTASTVIAGSAIAWCGAYRKQFDLTEDELKRPPASLSRLVREWGQTPVADKQDAYESFLRWCARPERSRPSLGNPAASPQAWCKKYGESFSAFGTAATKLLQQTCITQQNTQPNPAHGCWELFDVANWLNSPVYVLHPPLILEERPDQPLVRGRVVFQPIGRLLTRLREAVRQTATATKFPAIDVSNAIEAWPPLKPRFERFSDFRRVSGLAPWKPVDGDQNIVSLHELAHSILGVGRLLLADALGNDSKDDTSPWAAAMASVRLGLIFDGFSISSEQADCSSGRLIPLQKPDVCSVSETSITTHCLVHRGTRLLLGSVMSNCQALSGDLASAVEDLDWTIWFLAWSRSQINKLRLDNLEMAAATVACDLVKPDRWERVKRRLLTEGPSPGALLKAFDFVHSLGLVLCRDKKKLELLGPLGDQLIVAVQRCEKALLQEAHQIDPEGVIGIFPPRRKDGSCDIKRLVQEPWCNDERAKHWRFQWQSAEAAFGEVVREFIDHEGRGVIALSAGDCSVADREVLNAPFLLCCPEPPGGQYYAGLHEVGVNICAAIGTESSPDLAAALRSLRQHFMTPAGRQHFNALVNKAVDGDRSAKRWVELLKKNTHFEWSCYPEVVPCGGGWTAGSIEAGENLCWVDSEHDSADTVIETRYAVDAANSRRTLSRGQPAPESAEAVAASLVDCLEACADSETHLAKNLQEATDRWRLFADAGSHPIVDVLPALLNHLASDDGWEYGLRIKIHAAIEKWCRTYGHQLLPEGWDALQGVSVTERDVNWDVGYHASVPAGNLVVTSFGLQGLHGSPIKGYISAGPPPQGYLELVTCLRRLDDKSPAVTALEKSVAEFPRRCLADKQHLAGPALYDRVWSVVLESGISDGEWQQQLTKGVAELLLDTCQMSTFTPATAGEFPSDWLADQEGNPARGTWVVRVRRPGLRTAKNSLVWPAIVEME